jgi:hypothetical protein
VILLAFAVMTLALPLAASADPLEVKVGVLRIEHSRETISIVDIPPADDFIAGAKMAMADNNTTGKFLDQSFTVEDIKLAPDDDPIAAARTLLDKGVRYLIADLPADALLKVADAAKDEGALVFNAGAPDDSLREQDCRANVIHTAPSRSMLADGLAQYLIWKQWKKWFLVVGSHPEDVALGEAYERSAKKFGAKIVEKRVYEDTGGGRRSDSGVVQTQRQMPVFTQKRARLRRARRRRREARCSPAICPIAPGIRGRSSARAASGRRAGTLRTSSGARAVAEPVSAHVQARHERARQPGLGGHAHDRRRGRAKTADVPSGARLISVAGLRRSPISRAWR